jgi:hypothetical protein
MTEIIEWLESPRGEEWSRNRHSVLWRPLLLLVDDGDTSCEVLNWSDFRPLWVA